MAIQYNSNYDKTIPFSDVSYPVQLTASTELTITIPGNSTTQYQALFSYTNDANVFVRLNGTVAIPAPNTASLVQYTDFKPMKRYVKGGDVIHLITPDATSYLGVSLRQLQG